MARDDDGVLSELRERYEVYTTSWQEIRQEAEKDMMFVSGDPWDDADKSQRKNRPMVAPEEMAQYKNQVINQLRANPRGMRFVPTGSGANDKGARFYQNKAREIEYRSRAKFAYLAAAQNALDRSYGYLRVSVHYASERSPNLDLWIEPFEDPDMVLIDTDAKRPDASDMKAAFVHRWEDLAEFKRTYGKNAKVKNFGDWVGKFPNWVQQNKIQLAEYWSVETVDRTLMIVKPPAPQDARMLAPQAAPPPKPLFLFEDEIQKAKGRGEIPEGSVISIAREHVEYPEVWMRLTNGLEILHPQKWYGKYIPIVACYGKVIYVTKGGETQRKILSMTRFGRDPWKAFCYACSQELEVLGQVPKAPAIAYEGQLAGHETEWQESPHIPKAFLLAKAKTEATGDQLLPLPQRMAYTQHEHLQALEIVKEGFRRSIQAAMGSNFLPSQAQKRNEKSGIALEKIDQSASTGTYHFIDAFDDMVHRTGVIVEDLMDKIHDYQGETGILEADEKASIVVINDPSNPDAIFTKGDYLTTISTGPSSDAERNDVNELLDRFTANLAPLAQIVGPEIAKRLLGKTLRLRNGGPLLDQIADILDPPPPQGKDGKPIPPELMAAQQQIQQLTQLLQRAAMEKNAKVVETEGKFKIAQLQETAETQRKQLDASIKWAITQLEQSVKRELQAMALAIEGRQQEAQRQHEMATGSRDAAHAIAVARHTAAHDSIEKAKDRIHERHQARFQHDSTMAQGRQAAATGAVQAAIKANGAQRKNGSSTGTTL